eukprot:3959056-Lingulodinium_polyedra.AAC.1
MVGRVVGGRGSWDVPLLSPVCEPATLGRGAGKPAPDGPLPLMDPADVVDGPALVLERCRVAAAVL